MELLSPRSFRDATASPGPLVGMLLDGRYQVTSTIARGGMATVYQATDTRLEREVAVKAMHPFLADDPEFVRRFTREARAAARISDRHVVSVYDQGTDPRTHAVFLVMELVRGRTLRALLDERGRLTPREALSVMAPVASALGAAHATGVVHRDVKPENVLLGNDGRVLVADFGLARAVTASPATANAGLLIGTVAYLAPEQVRDGSADFRSDVYAAGVLLFELLTGRVPYDGDNPLSVAYRHLHEDIPPTGVDPRIDTLLASATSRDPARRPADGTALRARIATLRDADSDVMALAEATTVIPAVTASATPVLRWDPSAPPVVPAVTPGATTRIRTPTHVMPSPGTQVTPTTGVPPQPGPPVRPAAPSTGPRRDPLLAAALARPGGARPDRGLARLPRRRHGVTVVVTIALLLLTAAAGAAGWWFATGRYTSAPRVLGLDQAHAQQTVTTAAMRLQVLPGVNSDSVRPGAIVMQRPVAGGRILQHGVVAVAFSLGPVTHKVPLVGSGSSVADATAALIHAGLAVGSQTHEYSSVTRSGTVIATAPAGGVTLRHGSPVGLVISDGPAPVAVPRLKGALAIAAADSLQQAGLKGVVVSQHSDTIASGVVIDQSEPTGSKVARGSTVTYQVSLGPVLAQVPDVRGASVEDASATLSAAGFPVRISNLAGGYDSSVVAQTPRALSMVPEHSTITLYAF